MYFFLHIKLTEFCIWMISSCMPTAWRFSHWICTCFWDWQGNDLLWGISCFEWLIGYRCNELTMCLRDRLNWEARKSLSFLPHWSTEELEYRELVDPVWVGRDECKGNKVTTLVNEKFVSESCLRLSYIRFFKN